LFFILHPNHANPLDEEESNSNLGIVKSSDEEGGRNW